MHNIHFVFEPCVGPMLKIEIHEKNVQRSILMFSFLALSFSKLQDPHSFGQKIPKSVILKLFVAKYKQPSEKIYEPYIGNVGCCLRF